MTAELAANPTTAVPASHSPSLSAGRSAMASASGCARPGPTVIRASSCHRPFGDAGISAAHVGYGLLHHFRKYSRPGQVSEAEARQPALIDEGERLPRVSPHTGTLTHSTPGTLGCYPPTVDAVFGQATLSSLTRRDAPPPCSTSSLAWTNHFSYVYPSQA